MNRLSENDTNNAVSCLLKLRTILAKNLVDLEDFISRADEVKQREIQKGDAPSIADCWEGRTSVLSGIVSIDETLGWIKLMAAKDEQGNELDCVKVLPSLLYSSSN